MGLSALRIGAQSRAKAQKNPFRVLHQRIVEKKTF
jgi:hypothetical protein